MKIVHVLSADMADYYLHQGYEPIECSFGERQVVGPLFMDHHGNLSHLEGVAIRAYRDHFGALKHNPKFVTTGAADADACFAIAALAGELPDKDKKDLTNLANLINTMDVAPIGVHLEDQQDGEILLLWNQLSNSNHDATSMYAGVDRWRTLTGHPLNSLLEASRVQEAERVTLARDALYVWCGKVLFVESKCWGFDVWYEKAACVVALTPNGNVTIGCRDLGTAERLFGPGGLKNVFPHLQPAGWGGRETVGGSPRGMKIQKWDAVDVADRISGWITEQEIKLMSQINEQEKR